MSMLIQLLGAVGVGLLLVAFVLNLIGKLSETGRTYLILNIVGAGMSAIYAGLSGAIPFIVLESVWAGAAAVRLLTPKKKASA